MSFLRINELWRHYLSGRFSLEFIVCVGLFSAIILFNREFTHINYKQVYVTEFCILFTSLIIAGKLLLAGSVRNAVILLANPLMLLILAIIGLGIVTLLFSLENGTLAIKQSVIFLYASFVLLFSFSLRDRDMLLRWLILSVALISIYVALKLGIYLSLGITYEYERWRVVHDEADVIFCSLATLGLLLFRDEFCKRSQVLFYLLLLLNVLVLMLTMKRTAFIGLFGALLFCFIHLRWLTAFKRKHLYWLLIVTAVVTIVALLFPQLFHPLEQIVRSKLDVLNEGNSAWRIVAWQEALARFYQEPWLGSGYGHRILGTSIWAVDTMDPHNSYLAILVYNGLLGLLLVVAAIGVAFYRYAYLLRQASDVDARVIAFFIAGLIFIVVFPLFNVSLENQRQGIFFWFFISGAIFLDPQFRRRVDELFVALPPAKLHSLQTLGVMGLLAFAALVYSPGNYVASFNIYSPTNNGQYPSLQNPDEGSQQLLRQSDGLLLQLEGKNTEAYAHLFWIVSGKFLQEIKEKSVPYVIEFQLAEPIAEGIVIHLNRRTGGHINKVNLTPGTDRIRVSLEGDENYAQLDIYGLTLMVAHHATQRELLIKRVQILAQP